MGSWILIRIMKLFKSKEYTCEQCGEVSCGSLAFCPVCARYKSYRDYVQPSSVLEGELSHYKSLLTRYADLLEENEELKALVKDLQSELNENKELSV
jgi:predicted ATP-dependent serine protease